MQGSCWVYDFNQQKNRQVPNLVTVEKSQYIYTYFSRLGSVYDGHTSDDAENGFPVAKIVTKL